MIEQLKNKLVEGEDKRKKVNSVDFDESQSGMHFIPEKMVWKHVGYGIIDERCADKAQDCIRYFGTWQIRRDKEGNHGPKAFAKRVYATDRLFTDEKMMTGYVKQELGKAPGSMKKVDKKGASSGVLHTCKHCEKYDCDDVSRGESCSKERIQSK